MAGETFGGLLTEAQLQIIAVRADQADPALQLRGTPAPASASTISTELR